MVSLQANSVTTATVQLWLNSDTSISLAVSWPLLLYWLETEWEHCYIVLREHVRKMLISP